MSTCNYLASSRTFPGSREYNSTVSLARLWCWTGRKKFPNTSFSVNRGFQNFAGEAIKALQMLGTNQLLLETGAPYFAKKGRRYSAPRELFDVAETVAHHRGTTPEEIAAHHPTRCSSSVVADEPYLSYRTDRFLILICSVLTRQTSLDESIGLVFIPQDELTRNLGSERFLDPVVCAWLLVSC